jgi:hypothetical protein
MRLANILVSIALLVFSGFYAILIARLPSRDLPHTLGAAFVPWVLAGLLAILSLILLISTITSRDDNTTVVLPKRDLFGITGLLLLIALYVKLMSYLGFIPVSLVFLGILTWAAGSRKPLGIAVFSITTTTIIYLLFQKFFGVQLPAGILF